jgi:hypothetical protein
MTSTNLNFGNMKTEETVFVCTLNIRTILHFIWLNFLNRQVIVISHQSRFGLIRKLLAALLRFFSRVRRSCYVFDLMKDNDKETLASWIYRYPDLFTHVEAAQNRRYKFDKVDQFFSNSTYAFAFKHAVCTHTDNMLKNVARLVWVSEKWELEKIKFIGFSSETIQLFTSYVSRSENNDNTDQQILAILWKYIIACAVAAYTAIWALSRVRISKFPEEFHEIGADIVCFDHRFLPVLRAVADSPGKLQLVMRNSVEFKNCERWEDVNDLSRCCQDSGRLKIGDLPWCIGEITQSVISSLAVLPWVPTEVFLQVAKFPFTSIFYRAFFNRYQFNEFFARDDYNTSHIIRTQELRRRNIASRGVNHGLPVPEGNQPIWRYIDFDTYFCFGRDFYNFIYKETWPSSMKIVPIGSYSILNKHRARLLPERPNDIAILASAVPDNDEFLHFVSEVAARFPERTIYVKHKRSTVDENPAYKNGRVFHLKGLHTEWTCPKNVREVNTSIYDLAADVSYALTSYLTSSTAESIQMGVSTFVIDSIKSYSCWRRYPNLCLQNASQFIDWVLSIESGEKDYPWRDYAGLVDMSGQTTSDIIRQELGWASTNQEIHPIQGPAFLSRQLST